MGLTVLVVNGRDPLLQSGLFAILLIGLLVAAVWDARRRRVPNLLVLGLAFVGLSVSVWLRPLPAALLLSVSGLVVGGVVWLVPHLLQMAGAADVKLAAAVGIWLGPLSVFRVSIYAALVGGGMALLWLVWNRGALGSWVYVSTLPRTLRVGVGNIRERSISLPTLPFAIAILVGVGLELAGISWLGGVR